MKRTSSFGIKKVLLVWILIFLFSACGITPNIKPSEPVPASTTLEVFNQDIVLKVNQARATARVCGTKSFAATNPLVWNIKLEAAARVHSLDMLNHDFFDHTGSDGSSPWDRIKRQGYALGFGGENIAAGQPTTLVVISAWLKSAGHCANIMNPKFTEIGVAAVFPISSPNSPFWTMDLASSTN